jgi:hypothetical protein
MNWRRVVNKHIDDTRYLQWADGMYVMLDELKCDYEAALVENSMRDAVYYINCSSIALVYTKCSMAIDVIYGLKYSDNVTLTRAQALYIATGETTCTTC